MEIDWTYLFNAYAYWKKNAPAEAPEFFNAFFKKLAGSNQLEQALESGISGEEWVNSYHKELYQYKKKAYEYAMYPHLGVETYKSN